MKKNLGDIYDGDFYVERNEGMFKSAEIVLGLLYDYYQPRTIIDFGCGQGAWLAAAESLGAKKIKGFDGDWVKQEDLISKDIDFAVADFDESMPELHEKYDLCISLEVAEHISERNAGKFIHMLCEASGTVLFGAAIKHQGGRNHINEQWQSYWIDLFKSNGYECLDLFRGVLWNNPSVEYWYRQNTFLFIGPENESLRPDKLRSFQKPVFDVIHPIHYEKIINHYRNKIEIPTFRFCLRCVRQMLRIELRKIMGPAR